VAANPLITLLMAHIFISRLEQVTVRLAAGTALAVVGVILVAVSHQL
jgi:drug/metabolite transporter (DMT)-like permease